MKHNLLVLVAGLLAVALHGPSAEAQPANDDCANAIEIFAGDAVSGSTADATGTEVTVCSSGDVYDVWFAFSPTASGFFTVSLCGSDFNTAVSVFDGCGGTSIACNDDSAECGTSSQINCLELSASQQYLIRVSGYGNGRGNYTLSLAQCPVPSNDECIDATEIFAGDEVSGTTLASSGTDVSACSVDDFYDVWYSFTPTVNGFFTLSLCGSSFDTTLSILDGCGGTSIACNDDSNECGSRSQINCIELSASQPYLIRVSGYSAQKGDYVLSLEQCSNPTNDLCENAAALNKYEPISSTTFAATGTGLSTCSSSDFYDAWYSYTPETNESVDISLCGSSFDTTLSVFDSCGGTRLACNDDSTNCSYSIHSNLSGLSLTGGDTYLIRVAGFDSRRGYYTIAMSDAGAPVVTEIVLADAGPTASSSVYFYVYFSTPIIGFDDVGDLIINANGVTYDDVQISPSDDAWDVEFIGVQGNGELSIAVNTGSDVRRPDDVPLASSVTSAPVIIDTTAPVVSNITITPAVAVAGDTVRIDFESNEPLDLVEVLVNGNTAESAKSLYSYTYLVTEADAVGPAEIQISIFDLAGNVALVTENAQLVIQQAPELPVAAPPLAIALTFAGLWRLRQRRRG